MTTPQETNPKFYGGFFMLQNFTGKAIESGKIMHQFLQSSGATPLRHDYQVSEIQHGESSSAFPFITASSNSLPSARDYWGFHLNIGGTQIGNATCSTSYPLNLDPTALGATVLLQIVQSPGGSGTDAYTFNIALETIPRPSYPTNIAEFAITTTA